MIRKKCPIHSGAAAVHRLKNEAVITFPEDMEFFDPATDRAYSKLGLPIPAVLGNRKKNNQPDFFSHQDDSREDPAE